MAEIPKSAAVIEAVDTERLVRTASELVAVPSPTCQAGKAADCLAGLLRDAGFAVERPTADWPEAPAVVARLESGKPGRVLQLSGHLDTVHLPFVPPRVEEGFLYGSGASDMKGGLAACVEAMRVLRETGGLAAGGVLLTAYDHHEGPWGDKRQLTALIGDGVHGDGVLIPEYLADRLPVAGRGMAIFEVAVERSGEPAHEVLCAPGLPDVIGAGAQLVLRLQALNVELGHRTHPYAGRDSAFVGSFNAGQIYNQAPIRCEVSGTRRWVTPGAVEEVRGQFDGILEGIAADTDTDVTAQFHVQADAYAVDLDDPLVGAVQDAHTAVAGRALPLGDKPFVDDGNIFSSMARIPAVTHGPAATGAHTLEERVPVDELARVARVYAMAAVAYTNPMRDGS